MTNPIYIQNKYHTWYYNIIATAQSQDRVKDNETYFENHHIIPISLDGSNSIENLVLLTAREHFDCHYMLTKFTTKENKISMIYAFNMMCTTRQNERQYLNSKLYEANRIKHAKLVSENMKGKKRTPETKEKIRVSILGRKHNEKSIKKMSGKNHFKYSGDYHTAWGMFTSLRATANACPYKISYMAIKKWCNNPDKIITKATISQSIYLQSLKESPLGKTFREIGFWFIFK